MVTVALLATAAACAGVDDTVDSESRSRIDDVPSATTDPDASSIPEPDSDRDRDDPLPAGEAPDDEDPTADPPNDDAVDGAPPPTNPDEPAVVPDDALVFDLERVDVVATLRPTTADNPPGGYNGFSGAIALDDGTLLASGFDATSDGVQPERSALWRSDDGMLWERTGRELSDRGGQQTIQALYLDEDDNPSVVLADVVPTGGGATGEFELDFGVEWQVTTEAGGWGSNQLVGDAAVHGSYLTGAGDDASITLHGAADPNDPGLFTAVVFRHDPTDEWEPETIDLAPDGSPIAGSIVLDALSIGDTEIAVGATTATDALGDIPASYGDTLLGDGFTDVAVWRRDGTDWSRLDIGQFAGVNGGGLALDVGAVDGSLFMLTRSTQAYRAVLTLYRSDDLGDTWDNIAFDRNVTGGFDSFQNATFATVGDLVVIIDEVFDVGAVTTLMTVVDTTNGEAVTHDVTEWEGVNQIESIIDVDGTGLAFGRVDRGASESDLQVVELTIVDSPPPPPTGGGASDA